MEELVSCYSINMLWSDSPGIIALIFQLLKNNLKIIEVILITCNKINSKQMKIFSKLNEKLKCYVIRHTESHFSNLDNFFLIFNT